MTYAVIISVRNEEEYISGCLDHIMLLDPAPITILVVDDGSTDGTQEILHRYNRVFRYPIWYDRYLAPGANIARALNVGVPIIHEVFPDKVEFILKVDADTHLPSTYFSDLKEKMDENPKLGITSGSPTGLKVWKWHASDGAKLFRRECMDDVGPFIPMFGYDSFYNLRAWQKGWEVLSYPDVKYKQVRPWGPFSLMGWYLTGRAQRTLGYVLPYTVIYSILNMKNRPYILGGLIVFFSYIAHTLTGWKATGDTEGYYEFMEEYCKRVIRETAPQRLRLR